MPVLSTGVSSMLDDLLKAVSKRYEVSVADVVRMSCWRFIRQDEEFRAELDTVREIQWDTGDEVDRLKKEEASQ